MSKNDEQQEKKKKKEPMDGEKRFYLLTAIGCAVALTAIIAVAVIFTGDSHTATGTLNGDNNKQEQPSSGKDDNEQVVVTPEGFVMPVESVSVGNDYGFYYNPSVGAYYGHKGLDFSATAGTEVYSVDAGVIESITRDELLTGTEIVVDHGDGVKSVYRFVDAVENLKAGDRVEKGEQIATVAEPCGTEYKDGAHLHFEIIEDGKLVDPNLYLTLEEK